MKLFLSVDIINSTSFKDEYNASQWLPVIQNFHLNFPENYESEIDSLKGKDDVDELETNQIKIWKCLGDEIIFVINLENIRTDEKVIYYIFAFLKSLNSYQFTTDDETVKLDSLGLKGTAWLADFTLCNAVIKVKNNPFSEDEKYEEDYIGPQMDSGFRIGKYSAHKKFVLSIELAWALLRFFHKDSDNDLSNLIPIKFYLDTITSLKGVIDSNSYPIIFIILEEDEKYLDIEYKIFNKSSDIRDLYTSCNSFISKYKPNLIPPFTSYDIKYKKVNAKDCKWIYEEFIKTNNCSQPKEIFTDQPKPKETTNVEELFSLLQKVVKDSQDRNKKKKPKKAS